MKNFTSVRNLFSLLAASAALSLGLPLAAAAGAPPETAGPVTVTGEVLDMACYLDHGAHGEKHASCAQTCISSGLPVGLKSADGTVYLLIGEHKPANEKLAQYAAKTITVKGKLVSRDGINLLENIEIVP
jgi:type 1 fimbria pilin